VGPDARWPEVALSEGTRRVQRRLALLALLGVGVATSLGYLAAGRDEEQTVEQLADTLLGQASSATVGVVERASERLRGATVLVGEDGDVDRGTFEEFATDVLGENATAVALGLVVAGEDREAFEADEMPIVVRGRGDSFVPAPPADEHFPIVAAVTRDGPTTQGLGNDYASDADRAEAVRLARDTGSAVVTAPVRFAVSGSLGIVVIEPLYERGTRGPGDVAGRRRAFVGFLAQSYEADDVLAQVQLALTADAVVQVRDAGERLFGPGELEGDFVRASDVEVAGRTWRVAVDPVVRPDTTLPRMVLGVGIGTEAFLLALLVVTLRYQRRLRLAHAAERLAQRRSETLEGLAARLSRSLSTAEVGDALLEQLPPFTGTTAGAVLLLDPDLHALRLVSSSGYPPQSAAALDFVELAQPSAVAEAIRAAEPAWLASPLAWRDDAVTALFGEPGRALAIVPLVADEVVGLLVLVHPGVRTFYDDERSLLTTVAALAARALNRARRYDTEHHAAGVLQVALLPAALPEVAGFSVAGRYLPATDGLTVGGDWYDVFELPDRRLAVVVGDVVGSGVRAAAAMGQLRSAVRALTEVVPEPAALLQALEKHVPTIPDASCATVVYAVIDPAAARLTYVRAGHLPPLVIRPGGGAELLRDASSTPLGVTGGASHTVGVVGFEPGCTVVLYTDGVVERREEPLTAGLERLRRAGEEASGLDPDRCCDHLLASMIGADGHGDDAAVVAVRLDAVAVAGRIVSEGDAVPTTSLP